MGVEVKSGGEGVIVADRVVDAQRDQNIIQSVVAALKTTTAPAS